MALAELLDAYLNRDDVFRKKVAGACLMAAKDIIAEDAGTAGHAARIAWANSVRSAPLAMAQTMITKVLENATIAADVAGAVDSDIQFVVNSLINTFAGV